jgi:hypothetical protein
VFYELSHINDALLPQELLISGFGYTVSSGGLLLEPPQLTPDRRRTVDGYSVLRLFGAPVASGESDLLLGSGEMYRWSTPGEIDISRRDSEVGLRFVGPVDSGSGRLQVRGGEEFLAPGTVLSFVAASDSPITSNWGGTFDFGPWKIEAADPAHRSDPVLQEMIRQSIAADEARRRRAARTRLEDAWRAPVNWKSA